MNLTNFNFYLFKFNNLLLFSSSSLKVSFFSNLIISIFKLSRFTISFIY